MTIYDKTLFLQRLLFACEKASKFTGETDDSALWNYRHALQEAEKELDNACESVIYALELKGYLPQIKEVS